MDYESGKSRLTELADRERGLDRDRNEATTRLQLIDEILFSCLGWDRRACFTEIRHDGLITDYELGDPIRYCIWEAKREGKTFGLPAGTTSGIVSIQTLRDDNEELDKAIKQVTDYCSQRGVGVGVVCNGHQLVAFLASRQDGVPPLAGRALAFTSLDEISSSFRVFWDNLSFPGIQLRNLHKLLQTDSARQPPDKISSRLGGPQDFAPRDSFQTHLKLLADLVIADLADIPEQEESFLRACYSPSGALSQYALTSKDVIQSRYPAGQQRELNLDAVEPVSDKPGNLSDKFRYDFLERALNARPIILLGDVGVGKTIFLRHFLQIEAKKDLADALVFYVDFGKEPALVSDLNQFVLAKCEEILLNDYSIDIEGDGFVRGVYHGDLLRFEKGTWGRLKDTDVRQFLLKEIEFLEQKRNSREAHLKHCLEHISKGQERRIVVVLDNIDQRPPEFQEAVFLIGQGLASAWPATVFLSLRPSTFYESRVKGSLSAYHPRAFTVAPPRIDAVIVKRLQYAIDQLTATGHLSNLPQWLTVNSQSFLEYLHALLDAITQSASLMELIDNLSAGNVREALQFLNLFVGSAHVNSQRIIDSYKAGKNLIRQDDFLRAVILGERSFFDPAASPICNVFDISSNDGREHFLMPTLLSQVERNAADEGFTEARTTFQFGQSLGFTESQIGFALDRAVDKKLVDRSPYFSRQLKPVAHRLTTAGGYTLHRLLQNHIYVESVCFDTPILDPSVRAAISTGRAFPERLARTERFIAYLDSQWVLVKDHGGVFDWDVISQQLRNEVQRLIRQSSNRAQRARESRVRPIK